MSHIAKGFLAALVCVALLAGCGSGNGDDRVKKDRTEERRSRAERVREYLNSLERRIADLEQENSLQQSKIDQARRELAIIRAEVAAAARQAAGQKSGEDVLAGAPVAEAPAKAERAEERAAAEPEARRGLLVLVVLLAFITFVALFGLKIWRDQQKPPVEGAASDAPSWPPSPEAPPPDPAAPETDNYVKIRPPAETAAAPPPPEAPSGPPDPWAASGPADGGDHEEDSPRPS